MQNINRRRYATRTILAPKKFIRQPVVLLVALAVAVPANGAAPHGAPARACVVGVDVHQGRHAEVVGHVHDVAAIDVTTVSRVRIPGESVLVVHALDDLAATVGR